MLFFFANRNGSKVEEQKADSIKQTDKVKPVSDYQPKKFPPVPQKERTPASKKTGKQKPERHLSSVKTGSGIKVGKNYEVIADLATLPRAQYRPEMGKKVYEDKHHIFFHPASQQATEALPVALNPSNQKLYPVSPVLHLKGVDETERTQLKSEGMQEFYYHARMKLLSLETSPSTVLSQYQTLLKRGFDVRLEILKDPPKSK